MPRHLRAPLLLALLAAAIALGASDAAANTATACKVTHCAECAPRSSGRTCKLCNGGFYADKRGVCRKCSSSNCAICTATGTCAACELGYGVKGGRCHRCKLANCSACNDSPNTCQMCASGHGLVKRAGKPACAKCANKNCLQCNDSPAKCTVCKGRYEAVNGTCVASTGGGGNLLSGGGKLTGTAVYVGLAIGSYIEFKFQLPWAASANCMLKGYSLGVGIGANQLSATLNINKEGMDASTFCRTYMQQTNFLFGGGQLVLGGYAPKRTAGGLGVWDIFVLGLPTGIDLASSGLASWSGCPCS